MIQMTQQKKARPLVYAFAKNRRKKLPLDDETYDPRFNREKTHTHNTPKFP